MAPRNFVGMDSGLRASGRRVPLLCAWVAVCLFVGSAAPIHGHLSGDAHESVLVEAGAGTESCSLCSIPSVQRSVPDANEGPEFANWHQPEGPAASPSLAPSGIARAHPPRAPPAVS